MENKVTLREYEIPGTDYTAVLYEGEATQTIYDCEGDAVVFLPAEWDEAALSIWSKAYDLGYNRGCDNGKYSGINNTRREMLQALGIYDDLTEMREAIKRLANVLYWHDGICKEDVSDLAGR
jgi:hypothetical protein